MIYNSIINLIGRTPVVRLSRLFNSENIEVFAKLEFLNPGGSSKDRPAQFIIEAGLREGTINAATHLIESTSGNLGIALSTVARLYGLTLTCVVDPMITPANLKILRTLGARIEMVNQPDAQGGYLLTRIERVQELVRSTPNSVWVNQYANDQNWMAHRDTLAAEIVDDFHSPPTHVFVAVSTTGTIMGIARGLRAHWPEVKIVAVDSVGSVVFGGPQGPRRIPGIGSSRVPELLDRSLVDEVVYVTDRECVEGCLSLVNHEAILAGGSSGAVIAAVQKSLLDLERPVRVLVVLPDRGERYIDSVYNSDWQSSLDPCGSQGEMYEE